MHEWQNGGIVRSTGPIFSILKNEVFDRKIQFRIFIEVLQIQMHANIIIPIVWYVWNFISIHTCVCVCVCYHIYIYLYIFISLQSQNHYFLQYMNVYHRYYYQIHCYYYCHLTLNFVNRHILVFYLSWNTRHRI